MKKKGKFDASKRSGSLEAWNQALAHLCSAVNDASSRTTALWFSFLTFMAYLTMAVGSVTHVMLFRESPIKLPVLNVDLPLVAFFWIAPIFLVVFHFYLLLQTVILVRKIAAYRQELDTQPLATTERERYSAQLDTFPVVQLLVGSETMRGSFTAALLQFITVFSFAIAPILLLLQFQLTFLPYHHGWVTWLHRGAIAFDLGLIWILWSSIKRGDGKIRTPQLLRDLKTAFSSLLSTETVSQAPAKAGSALLTQLSRYPTATLCSVVTLVFSVFYFTYPSEAIGQFKVPCPDRWVASSDCIFTSTVDMVIRKPRVPFPNVLVLPGEKFADFGRANDHLELSVRGRDLEGAVLVGADLRNTDFTGANLNRANFADAKLQNAQFGCEEFGDRIDVRSKCTKSPALVAERSVHSAGWR